MSPWEFPHMSTCGALHLSERPPFGVPSEVYITDILSYKILLTHRNTVQSSLPSLWSSLPASMSSKAFSTCFRQNAAWWGKNDQWEQDLSSILIQTTISDRCISHKNYPNENGYGKPTSHPIQPHSSTASHGHRTCTRSCLFGLGGGQGEGLPQNLFWKRKGEISSSRRVSI